MPETEGSSLRRNCRSTTMTAEIPDANGRENPMMPRGQNYDSLCRRGVARVSYNTPADISTSAIRSVFPRGFLRSGGVAAESLLCGGVNPCTDKS